MRKRVAIGIVTAGILFVGAVNGVNNQPQPTDLNSTQPISSSSAAETTRSVDVSPTAKAKTEKVIPICDGTTITTNCSVDGINYATYIYHPAVAEKTHTETTTTYEEKVTGYCTLCNDGTYSPSCATGSGACSHHGGVAQWNAPRYGNVPVYGTKTVVDSPAQEAYYEKVAQ